jgi:hypothetical protein
LNLHMKLRRFWLLSALLFFSLALTAPACSKKSGCEASESLKPRSAPKKKSKRQEGLMPKSTRKKVGGEP